jgi:hypothetical protein
MQRTYDIFEIKNGQPLWMATVEGHEAAIQMAMQLSKQSTNELRVMHIPTNSIVAVFSEQLRNPYRPRGPEPLTDRSA